MPCCAAVHASGFGTSETSRRDRLSPRCSHAPTRRSHKRVSYCVCSVPLVAQSAPREAKPRCPRSGQSGRASAGGVLLGGGWSNAGIDAVHLTWTALVL